MAISVDGYGNITQGNAKEIYTAWKRGDLELNKSQQTKCESFLSPEDLDEVQYDETVTKNRGAEAINTENAKDNGNGTEGASVAASGLGSIAAIIMSTQSAGKLSNINGFFGLAGAIVAIVASAAAMVMAFVFDDQLNDRKQHSQNAANDNNELDKYNDALGATMEMMNEDVEHYNETQDELTTTVNTQTSVGADLQMQLDTAMAAGDMDKAQQLREQIKALKEVDNSALEDELAETGAGIEEYRAMNIESAACAESGQTVSDFLKAGTPKGKMALANGVLCTVGAAVAATSAISSGIPKVWVLGVPVDLPSGLAGTIMWGAVGAMLGTASGIYYQKASQESECGSNGEEMQEHVTSLNDMIEQQTAYTEDTEGQYAESDEAAAESKDAATESAGKAVSTNKENLGGGPKEEEETPAAGGIM